MQQTQTQSQVLKQAVDVDKRSVYVLILKPQSIVDIPICGRNTIDWVKSVVSDYQHKIIDIQRGEDIVALVRTHMNGVPCKYCLVVYADTPLVTNKSIDQALSFAATYSHRVVALPRGWIFDMHFISNTGNVEAISAPNLDQSDFTVAYNLKQIAIITSYARQRINDKHMDNNVHITDPYSVYIDCDVTIGAGTRIHPLCVITGASVVGKDCVLGASVNIIDTIIGDNVRILDGSTITQEVASNNIAIARARQASKEQGE